MEKYKVIADKEKLLDFIDWLPELRENEVFYGVLMARRKYYEPLGHVKSDSEQVSRFAVKKEHLFNTIRKLEVDFGLYTRGGIVIPNEALVLYINPNPRSLKKATQSAVTDMFNALMNNNIRYDPANVVMRQIHKSKSRTCVTGFDYDNLEFPEVIFDMINKEALTITRTRGGYHIFVTPSLVDKKFSKTWHNKMSGLASVDLKGDFETVVPGCYQSNFEPYHMTL